MDEFKPEDELKPDPSDRRPGRSRKPAEFDNEPQINIDDVDLDAEDRRPARTRRAQTEETYEADESLADDEVQERRPRKRKKAPPKGPISRQHLMMALGILVLVLLIIGIGSALKGPDANKADDAQAQNTQKTSICPVTQAIRPIRLTARSRSRAIRPPRTRLPAIRRRIFRCHRSPLRRLRPRRRPRRKASSVSKCRAN